MAFRSAKNWIQRLVAAAGVLIFILLLVAYYCGPECERKGQCKEQSAAERLEWYLSWLEPDAERAARQQEKTKRIPDSKPPKLPLVTKKPAPVDSLAAKDQYDILKWNLVGYRSGNVDIVRAENDEAPRDGSIKLAKGSYVTLSGWAGHPAFGMRFRDVLFSLCGKVVGRAAVQISRPDVAKAVHKNLLHSGWKAKLATDLLPQCEEQVLQVWGVAPIGFNIFPLTGKTTIVLTNSLASNRWEFFPESKILTPAQNGPAELKSIGITASSLRLRKCGDPACDIVGRIARGAHQGYVLETVDNWSLVQIGESVGWAYRKFLQVQ